MPDKHLKVVESSDNVATAIRTVDANERIDIGTDGETVTVETTEDVPFGHKVALRPIPEGETLYKYGKSVGYASRDIQAGEWVHTHNVESNYGRGDLADDSAAQTVSE